MKSEWCPRQQSSCFQSIASIPEEIFEQAIAAIKAEHQELTSVAMHQQASRLKTPELALTPSLPQGKYRCLILDPPWPVKKIEREERPNQGVELDYPTMTIEEIAASLALNLNLPWGNLYPNWTLPWRTMAQP